MGVERTGFELLMTADASGVVKGSKEAGDALGGVAGKTKDLNTELETGKGKLEEHGKGLEEGGKHAHLFGEHAKEVHVALHGLHEILPQVAALSRDLFSVQTLGIGLVSMGLGMLVEHFQAAGEEEKKLTDEFAKGAGKMMDAQATAAEEAAGKHEALAEALKKAAGGESAFLRAMENRIKTFKDYIAALEAVEKAEDEAEEARIKRQVRNKEISAEEGETRIGAIHGKAETRTEADKDKEAEYEIGQHELALANAQKEQEAAKKAQAEAEARAAEAKTKAGATEGIAAEDRKKLYGTDDRKGYENPTPESLQGKVDAAIAEYDKMLNKQQHNKYFIGENPAVVAEQVKEAKEAMEEAVRRRDAGQAVAKSDEATHARHVSEQKAAEMEAAAARKRAEEAGSVIDKFGGPEGQVAQEKAQLERDRARRAAVQAVHDQAAKDAQADADKQQDKMEANAADAVAVAKRYIGESSRDIPGSAGAKADIKILTETIRDLTGLLDQFTKAHMGDAQGLGAEIEELKRQVNWLSQRITFNHNGQ
jgi:hypothetical protein